MTLRALIAVILTVSLTGASRADAPLADAAEKKDGPKVTALLASKVDVNSAQTDGTTALHWAAYHDDAGQAKLLLKAGANAKAENRYGVTPLSLACTNGGEELVRTLLAAGANPNATLRGGETVLHTASRTGRVGPVKVLLDAGAKTDAADRKGQSPLMWAAADGHAGVVELLVKSGADAKARLKSGFTPMLFAVREGRAEVVKTLLKHGIDANEAFEVEKRSGGTAPADGLSALGLAIENGHFALAAELLKAGADPNDQKAGFTPLHRLTWVRKPNRGDDPDGQPPPNGSGTLTSLQMVRTLVVHGANVNAKLTKQTAGHGRLAKPGTTPFLFAARTADLAYLKLLVELGADPSLTNENGSTPLMAAAGLGSDARQDEAGTEPEAVAACEYLLSLKADVNAKDKNGETAVHGAAYKSFPLVVRLLTERGAKAEVWYAKNKSGWTPLLIAEGFRPGNFTPSFETVAAIHTALRTAGITPPPPTARPATGPAGYVENKP